MRIDRVNRIVLPLVGLLFLASGSAVIAAGIVLSGDHRGLLDNPVSRFAGDESSVMWLGCATVAAIIIFFTLWWFIELITPPTRVSRLSLRGDRPGTPTTVRTEAVTTAMVAEIVDYGGVRFAHARIQGSAHKPRLTTMIRALDDTDIPALHEKIVMGAIAHIKQVLGNPGLPTTVDVDLIRPRSTPITRAR